MKREIPFLCDNELDRVSPRLRHRSDGRVENFGQHSAIYAHSQSLESVATRRRAW